MVSRETGVHVICVVAGFAALAALTVTGVTESFGGQVLALGLFYGLTFGGAHLYFALRGQGDGAMVPVTGRWRFVGLVAALTVLAIAFLSASDAEIAGVAAGTLAAWAFALLLFVYFLVEGVAGYRQSMQRP